MNAGSAMRADFIYFISEVLQDETSCPVLSAWKNIRDGARVGDKVPISEKNLILYSMAWSTLLTSLSSRSRSER